MVVGLAILGIVTGFGAAVISLFLGYSILAAIGFYVLAANVMVFSVIGLCIARHALTGSLVPMPAPATNRA